MADIEKINDGDIETIEGGLRLIVDKINELVEAYNEHCHDIFDGLTNRRLTTGYPEKHPNSSVH